ncbi:MAG: hypothetical protein HYY05_09010 [Chloroflexi bacterium]|nr:hypothetical protein [Chloroflexota bacterium]
MLQRLQFPFWWRLNRRETALLAIAVAALAYTVYLYLEYDDLIVTRERLATQRANVEREYSLAQAALDTTALQNELARVRQELTQRQGTLIPATIDGLSVLDMIAQAGRASGVRLANVQSVDPPTEKIGDRQYRTIRFATQADGSLAQLVDFLSRMEGRIAVVFDGIVLKPVESLWRIEVLVIAFGIA